jgi:hypothetical protein
VSPPNYSDLILRRQCGCSPVGRKPLMATTTYVR